MSILGIIVGIVLVGLILKAIYETIIGSCLVINGIFWHAIAFILDGFAYIVRIFGNFGQMKTISQRKQREEKMRSMMADPLIADLIRIGSYRSKPTEQTSSLSTARQRDKKVNHA